MKTVLGLLVFLLVFNLAKAEQRGQNDSGTVNHHELDENLGVVDENSDLGEWDTIRQLERQEAGQSEDIWRGEESYALPPCGRGSVPGCEGYMPIEPGDIPDKAPVKGEVPVNGGALDE